MPRIVCISGGTSGIGERLVAAFLEEGDRVWTFGRDGDKVATLRAHQAQACAAGALHVLVGDVTDEAFRAALVQRLRQEEGRLDVLVNNAAVILGSGDIEETVAAWRTTLEVNLIAPFALTKDFVALLESGENPVVINISSACGQHPFETCTSGSYSASKAGLDLMTRRLAMALGPRGIRVNAIAPGVVASPMWGGEQALIEATAQRRHRLHGAPIEAQAIAEAVCFLASNKARHITGAKLNVDAGYTLG